MRHIAWLAAGLGLLAGPCLAQSTDAPPPAPPHHHTHHHTLHHTIHHTLHQSKHHAVAGGEKPIDNGPNTPDANSAYQGGGVVLQGAPGAPAPRPQATPPGQTPAGAVPHS